MVTASHNPARYNGYKAYAADGAQISGHVAAAVSEEIEKTDIFRDVKLADFEEALADGRIKPVVYRTFAAADVVQAHELMESSQHIGKIVLIWSES